MKGITCPHCGNDDPTLLELLAWGGTITPISQDRDTQDSKPTYETYTCGVCSKNFTVKV